MDNVTGESSPVNGGVSVVQSVVDDVVMVERKSAPARACAVTDAAQESQFLKDLHAVLSSGRCDRYKVQQVCEAHDRRIPSVYRQRTWAVLLGVHQARNQMLGADLATTEEDLSNQRVVAVDVERTRQTLPLFHNIQVKQSAVKILTFYCKRKARIYRQGLNEILAPFLYLCARCNQQKDGDKADPELTARQNRDKNAADAGSAAWVVDEALSFNMFYAFITHQLPNMFRDGFYALQYQLRCLALLLRYHDPELAVFLEQHDIGQPVLYATSWVLTAFAHDLPMPTLLVLWDTYILEESPLLHLFVCLAWLLHFRQQFIAAPSSVHDVVATMRDTLRLVDEQQVLVLVRRGRDLMRTTPKSCRAAISRTTSGSEHSAQGQRGPNEADVARVERLPCITVSAKNTAQRLAQGLHGASLPSVDLKGGATDDGGGNNDTHGTVPEVPEQRQLQGGTDDDVAPYVSRIMRARKRLTTLMSPAVIVDTRPEPEFAKHHVVGSCFLDPRFLSLLEKQRANQQQQRQEEAKSAMTGALLARPVPRQELGGSCVEHLPYAQKFLQTIRAELSHDPERPILVVGESEECGFPPGPRSPTGRGHGMLAHGDTPAGALDSTADPATTRAPRVTETPDLKRVNEAVRFLTQNKVRNVCIVEGGYDALRQALENNADLEQYCARYNATACEGDTHLVPRDVFKSAGTLDTTLLRVESVLDSAAEAATTAVAGAASVLERNLVAGASEVREGVTSAARTVKSSLSSLASATSHWLRLEADAEPSSSMHIQSTEEQLASESGTTASKASTTGAGTSVTKPRLQSIDHTEERPKTEKALAAGAGMDRDTENAAGPQDKGSGWFPKLW